MNFAFVPKQHIKYLWSPLPKRQYQLLFVGTTIQRFYYHLAKRKPIWPSISRFSLDLPSKYSATEINASTKPSAKGSIDHEDLDYLDADASTFSLKTALYTDTDEIIKELNQCDNYKALLDTIKKRADKLDYRHHLQSIILLWSFYSTGPEACAADISASGIIPQTLNALRTQISKMDLNELSCCYLYLRKMNVPNTDDVLWEVLLRALDKVKEAATPPPLPTLSRLVVGINHGREFHTPSVGRHLLPHITEHIKICSTAEDLRLLAVCLYNVHPLIDTEIVSGFKALVYGQLKNGTLNAHTTKPILKLLHMLNMPQWSHENTSILRELLLLLDLKVGKLKENELKTAQRVFQYHCEPAQFTAPLLAASTAQLQNEPNIAMLSCVVPFLERHKREQFRDLFRRLLTSEEAWQMPNAGAHFFEALRSLKISDAKTCNAYWHGVLRQLESNSPTSFPFSFWYQCHRYMNFNNNLGGTYRYTPLEKKLSEFSMIAIEQSLNGRIPGQFARLASFVIAYGHTGQHWKKIPNVILSKIILMADQFSVADCFHISRGLQIALDMRFRFYKPSMMAMQLDTIDSVLCSCANRHLSGDGKITTDKLNYIVRTLGYRKTLKSSVVYHEAHNRYKSLTADDLNSRSLRDMAYNLTASGFHIPEAMTAMFSYMAKNRAYILGETVEKILTCAYNVGYTPQDEDVLQIAGVILLRDFEHMNGLSLVQACLALCYYKAIPEELINKVFCVKFIQRVEEEIQMCYAKATYPERVLNMVMQLNRTVCLDFPEANVPWFQQNYIEAQLSKSRVKSKFSADVKGFLLALLKDETYFRCNHTTPYGYQIDFVIHFDQTSRKLVPTPTESTMLDRITKVAILLLKLDSFSENDLTVLRGPESLRIKHLEMLGYKVLHINEHDWNSKYLSLPSAKENFIKNLLQISHG